MKLSKFLLPVGLLAIVLLGWRVFSAASAPLPEGFPAPTPAGKIEIKHYPAYRAATVPYSGELSEAANRAFGSLYRHISSNDISMTAPVETRYPISTLETSQGGSFAQVGVAYVSFVYHRRNITPEQIEGNIQVEDIPPMTVVSLGMKGSYSYVSYQQSIEQLKEWLAQHSEYTVAGTPRRFFYDSPFVPEPLKRSEVQVPIRPVND
ncbi:ABC transporter substrate-binding protein [Moorena producens PAL-8-15-08-1]|uniref:ABC transporter substrate-binding protein n=1 Tax=Moorena producens PAL-8-15-08-1 TaxID=1458985 RepID=A0A1D8TXX0_9CYAN|nr:heme-binding protein [Moorena producens]AOX02511.1 ABC transporter substrate-binding protein [Moorena producens PAL-8-15-08-1]